MSSAISLQDIVKRMSYNPQDAFCTLVAAIQPYMVAGERVRLPDGRFVRSLGWIVISHVCREMRAWMIDAPQLWLNDVFSFPSLDAVNVITARASTHTILLSDDRLNRCTAIYSPAPQYAATPNLLRSFWNISATCRFSSLTALDMYVPPSIAFPPIVAPNLRKLALRGLRDYGNRLDIAWKKCPTISTSALRATFQAAPKLRRLYIVGIDISLTHPITRMVRMFTSFVLEARNPATVTTLLATVRPSGTKGSRLSCLLSFNVNMPEWVWLSSDLVAPLPLAAIVESSTTMVWVTFIPHADLPCLGAAYKDNYDDIDLHYSRQMRPNLLVRHRRVSRMYNPDGAADLLNQLLEDIRAVGPRINTVVVRELQVKHLDTVIWLRPSNNIGKIVAAFIHSSRVVIEDERLRDLIEDIPRSVSHLDIVCRDEWRGPSILGPSFPEHGRLRIALGLDLRVASPPRNVRLSGVRRPEDHDDVSGLLSQVRAAHPRIRLRDERDESDVPPLRFFQGRLHAARRRLWGAEMTLQGLQYELDSQNN